MYLLSRGLLTLMSLLMFQFLSLPTITTTIRSVLMLQISIKATTLHNWRVFAIRCLLLSGPSIPPLLILTSYSVAFLNPLLPHLILPLSIPMITFTHLVSSALLSPRLKFQHIVENTASSPAEHRSPTIPAKLPLPATVSIKTTPPFYLLLEVVMSTVMFTWVGHESHVQSVSLVWEVCSRMEHGQEQHGLAAWGWGVGVLFIHRAFPVDTRSFRIYLNFLLFI